MFIIIMRGHDSIVPQSLGHAVSLTINSHCDGEPPSNEQVAESIGPTFDEHRRVSNLARGTSTHCSSTTTGSIQEESATIIYYLDVDYCMHGVAVPEPNI